MVSGYSGEISQILWPLSVSQPYRRAVYDGCFGSKRRGLFDPEANILAYRSYDTKNPRGVGVLPAGFASCLWLGTISPVGDVSDLME